MLRFLQWLVARRWLMRLIGGLSGSLNPWSPDVRQNPYPAYAAVRAQPSLMRVRLFGGYVAARYADVETVLRSPAFSTNRDAVPLMGSFRRAAKDTPEFLTFLDQNLLMIDGEHHRRLRGLVSKAFTPRRIEMLRPRVEAIVDDLLSRASRRGTMDVMSDLAQPLPAIVIAELLGV